MVRIVLVGVVRVRVGPESPVDDSRWRVDIDFSRLRAAWGHGALARLNTNISDRPVERRPHKFSVVFIHYLAVYEC